MANHEREAAKERRWRDALTRYAHSGLSVRAYCRREQLAEASFYAWRRTIRARDGQSQQPAKSRPTKRIGFVSAVVRGEPRRDDSITIELAGGRVLRLPGSMAAARLAELAVALEAQGAP